MLRRALGSLRTGTLRAQASVAPVGARCMGLLGGSKFAGIAQRPVTHMHARKYYEWKASMSFITDWTKNKSLQSWILDRFLLLRPDRIHLCDGSEEENEELLRRMTQGGALIKLDDKLRPNSYLARSTSNDVARVEESTFICSEFQEDAGPTNNWRDPEQATQMMNKLWDGCMAGRVMYVVPFSMGPVGSPFSQIGVQITDSPYAVINMRIMTRMGKEVVEELDKGHDFIPCVHSVGMPLARDQEETTWPCNPTKYIVHFPEQRRIWSYGSGYGGNALLGKKCLALRIASYIAREEGWLAEHMLIVGITNPEGVKKYIAAAFPSACGKTNLAMMTPNLPGWKVQCVGDDIAWLRVGKDGRLWAINPESGFFGVAPGTSMKSNPNAMLSITENTIFTNCALTRQNDVWWEGMTPKNEAPKSVQSWMRKEWQADSDFDAAHPNARFTTSIKQCPVVDPNWDDPQGVPISAIIFGGRRSTTVPLVYQSRDWAHGTFLGATMNSETTAAAAGKRGVLRNDPFAMKPFCGYNMGDYFSHWLTFATRTEPAKLPKVFHVNWFRKNKSEFLWPGFGENIRVIEWIFNRAGRPDAAAGSDGVESDIGILPAEGAINVAGLDVSAENMRELSRIDANEWIMDVRRNREWLKNFGDRLPAAISQELDDMEGRLTKTAKAQAAKP